MAALVCLVALGSCGDDEPEVKTGTWGGLGTELNVTGSGATVKLCCNGTGAIQEPLTPDASGHFKARGTVNSTPSYAADYEGTVSGDSMQLKITAYPPNTPGGVVLISPYGSDYRSLTYGTGFVEKEGTNPPVGCVCGPCVGCPP